MKKKIIKITFAILLIFVVQFGSAQDSVLKSLIDIVSPIEVSSLIKSQKISYDKSVLNSASNDVKYQSEVKKALNLGVYSTDLGYASINDQNQDALYYLGSLKKMAEGLNLGKYIDTRKVFELASSRKDLNRLLDETSNTFVNMSDDLESKGKSNLAALILTGGWIETFYITCEVAKKYPNQELHNRIIEQKLILSQVLDALKAYPNDEVIKSIAGDLMKLNATLASYKLVEEKSVDTGNAEYIIVNGEKVRVDTGETRTKDIKLSASDVTKISNMVAAIRNEMVK